MGEEYLTGVRDDGSKINVTSQNDIGDDSNEGSGIPTEKKQEMIGNKVPEMKSFGYGDPQNPFGKVDNKFYGHFLPEHFKKTNIISTKGLER